MQYLKKHKKVATPESRQPENMNASQDTSWQKIVSEAYAICDKFRQMGYKVRKKVRLPVWSIGGNQFRYELQYLPRPVEEWTLLPNDGSPIRDRLILLLEQALAARGAGR